MLHLSVACRYYLYRGITDMRKGFDSLSGIVSSEMRCDVLSGFVFIFINKKLEPGKAVIVGRRWPVSLS